MTIAACYLASDGIVLGADSTSTVFVSTPGEQGGTTHHFNFGQKVFELGKRGSNVGVVLWGLGSLGNKSYRTLLAEIADEADKNKLTTIDDVADLASSMFWKCYTDAFSDIIEHARELNEKGDKRNSDEEEELALLWQNLSGGFCIAGRWNTERLLKAFEITFHPLLTSAPNPKELVLGKPKFWGCPNLIERLTFGIDQNLYSRILDSSKWTGTNDDLFDLVWQGSLGHPSDLPLREAIDWIYASIYTTIKGMKFSHLAPVCGGPIEVAAITSDRPFRWVHHKRLGQAVVSDQIQEEHP